MRKLFQKNKPVKTSREVGEDIPKLTVPTPLYQKLATHGAHIHGAISQPVFQQSTTQISPPPSEEAWPTSVPPPPPAPVSQASQLSGQQEPMDSLPNPHSPPINGGVSRPMRSDSLHTTPMSQVLPSPGIPRSASPISMQPFLTNGSGNKYGGSRFGGDHHERRNPSAVGAVGILSSLEPPKKDGALSGGLGNGGSGSWGTIPAGTIPDEREGRYLGSVSDLGHGGHVPTAVVDREKEKKKGFWNVRDRDKEKEREREREQREREREAQLRKERHEREQRERGRETSRREDEGELTRMIGYLTATAAEDWALLMEVCERASSTDTGAKEAVRALRREFKYGEPPAQLSAARVWAVILRNSSEIFISQSTSRKFLDTIEDLLSSPKTSPVVRERLLEVVAAAAYASGSKKGSDNQGFKGLWRKIKPFDKPEEGVPFDMEDAMFQPPQSGRLSAYDIPQTTPVDPSNPTTTPHNTHKKRKSPSNQIIPLEEDMRRLFQECKIGQGNAAVLADALLRAKPEDLKKVDVIKEFHTKCLASQELICAQIPWATSLAERSRTSNLVENMQQQRNNTAAAGNNDGRTNSPVVELTAEEKLLAALLAANAELLEVLRQWEDLNRLALERKVEDRSRRDVRINRPHREQDYEKSLSAEAAHLRVSTSRTPSPSRPTSPPGQPPTSLPPPPSSFPSDHTYQNRRTPSLYDSDSDPSIPTLQQSLAPPPAAPHGPRSPAPVPIQRSTTSSPSPTPLALPLVNGHAHFGGHEGDSDSLSSLEEDEVPVQPSAKALGKRKVIDVEVAPGQPADVSEKFRGNRQSYQSTNGLDPDVEDDQDPRWRHPPIQFVYDAVAERRRQMMLESRAHAEQQQQWVNGVH